MSPCRIACCRISGFVNKKFEDDTTRGAQNFIWEPAISGKKPVGTEAFQLGRDHALHAGQAYQKRLYTKRATTTAIETIVVAHTCPRVHAPLAEDSRAYRCRAPGMARIDHSSFYFLVPVTSSHFSPSSFLISSTFFQASSFMLTNTARAAA